MLDRTKHPWFSCPFHVLRPHPPKLITTATQLIFPLAMLLQHCFLWFLDYDFPLLFSHSSLTFSVSTLSQARAMREPLQPPTFIQRVYHLGTWIGQDTVHRVVVCTSVFLFIIPFKKSIINCHSIFSNVVTKHHGQSKFQKKVLSWGLQLEWKSMIIIVGNMAAGKQTWRWSSN